MQKNSCTKKRVLVVTPTPTHPQNAGNRARIFSLLKELQKLGHEIHVLYDGTEHYAEHVTTAEDVQAMSAEWDNCMFVSEDTPCTSEKYPTYPAWVAKIAKKADKGIGKIGHALHRHMPRLYNILKPFARDNFLNDFYNRTIEKEGLDRWYTHTLDEKVYALAQKNMYDIVLVEYVFLSYAFTHFDESVLKVLDTHDIFANRNALYEKKGLQESFYSATREEEDRGFARADIILAIQEQEASVIRNRTCKPVVTLGHIVEGEIIEDQSTTGRTVGFLATGNSANKAALEHITQQVLPEVQKVLEGVTLLVVGAVGNGQTENASTTYLGEVSVEELPSVYAKMDVVLNTTKVGTGLKIKFVEALAYGKAIVSTKKAVEGYTEANNCSLVVEEDAVAEAVLSILGDKEQRRSFERRAKEQSRVYNSQVRRIIRETFCMPPQQGVVAHGKKASKPSTFIIFTWPRSGATSLTKILSAHRDIAIHDEPFHHRDGKQFKPTDIRGPHEYVKELQKKRPGIKHNWGLTFEQNAQILLDTNQKIIFYTRENVVQREVSLFIAQCTDWWSERTRDYIPPKELPSIDIRSAMQRMRAYQRDVQRYRVLLTSNSVPFFEFRYEDFFDSQISTQEQMKILSQIGDHIGYSFGTWAQKNKQIQQALNPSFTRPDTEEVYRLIPNIEEVAHVAEQYGFGTLFIS